MTETASQVATSTGGEGVIAAALIIFLFMVTGLVAMVCAMASGFSHGGGGGTSYMN